MKCNNVREELVAYIDGELSSMEVQTIEAHLADCKECAAEHDKLTTTIESTHKVGDIQPAQNWWETLQERLYAPDSDLVSAVADPNVQAPPAANEDLQPNNQTQAADTSKMLCEKRRFDRAQTTNC
ncbi:zf-HC2 domain-containing protein [Candidatus Poribacteria bacterium]|nr:zf-HC2 domain-containing protein [Candidatus Poribacteria bacterium]